MDEIHKILCAIGVNEEEKTDLDTFQLKDVSQVFHKMWRDCQAPREVPIVFDILKNAFLQRFFPTEHREDRLEEFINL